MSTGIMNGEDEPRLTKEISQFDRSNKIHARKPGDEQAPRPPGGPRPLGLSGPQAVLQDHYPAAKQMPQPKRKQQGA
jgi:hypothetical protein